MTGRELEMFSFLEKNLQKRVLFNYLLAVGLDLDELKPGVVKQLLRVVHQQVLSVSRKYKQPPHIVSENIVCSASWGIAYCLLGPSKLLDVYPEFKDRTEEAEMELLLLRNGEMMEHNIYQQIFAFLLETPHCHPEVRSIYDHTYLTLEKPIQTMPDNSCLLPL
ncbi:MAG: hypothetical protein B6D77_08950 [gamma proteobacterium symbiont of Ctena orbiculata]|nr:MAG: hypothetical protein B6D77_08950 [gamma proteobacterium symbiont of Ctena orbiculata]